MVSWRCHCLWELASGRCTSFAMLAITCDTNDDLTSQPSSWWRWQSFGQLYFGQPSEMVPAVTSNGVHGALHCCCHTTCVAAMQLGTLVLDSKLVALSIAIAVSTSLIALAPFLRTEQRRQRVRAEDQQCCGDHGNADLECTIP